MATNNFEKELRPFESMIADKQGGLSGSSEILFSVRGNRLILELQITAVAGTLNLLVENSFDPDNYFTTLLDEDYTATQTAKLKLSDIHKFFRITLTATGGAATYVLGATIADDSANDSELTALAGFLPFEYDELEVTDTNVNGDPTEIVYRNNGVDVGTLTITYDVNNNVQHVIRT